MQTRRIEFEGIPLGNKGEPIQPTVEAFRQRGIVLSTGAASGLKWVRQKGEPHNGREISDRGLCSIRLGSNDASLKNAYYLEVANAGVSQRVCQEQIPQRWSSVFFTEKMAQQINQSTNDTRLAIRAMRTDLVYMELDHLLDERVVKEFIATASGFIDAYNGPFPSAARPSAKRIKEQWDHQTISNFYSALYDGHSYGKGATIGIWTPFEAEVMQFFYQNQAEKGNSLTTLDMLVLQSYAMANLQQNLVDAVRGKSRVDIDAGVLIAHRNALLFGQPRKNN